MFRNVTESEPQVFAESIDANETSKLTQDKILLGKKLVEAFHDKSNPDALRQLVRQGAPVNYRLDYGLEVKREADFVASFFLMLEGNLGESELHKNAKKLVGDDHYLGLSNYVKTAYEIYNILYGAKVNDEIIPINPAFITLIENSASTLRANPEHANSALIISAGMRTAALSSLVIASGKGKEEKKDSATNGAAVNFKGYFGDTAAVWSAILLDAKTLSLLLDEKCDIENLGVSQSSLLHWIILAGRLNRSQQCVETVKAMITLLLQHGANPHAKNKLNKSSIDYADSEIRLFLENATSQSSLKNHLPSLKKSPSGTILFNHSDAGVMKNVAENNKSPVLK